MKWILFYLVQSTWGLLQNAAGLIVFILFLLTCHKKERYWYNGAFICHLPNPFGSISLGCFIFVANISDNLIMHEYGHTIQSLILGPLYILVIGIPSFIWASCFRKYRLKKKISYYSMYTEKWANKLGKVDIR